MSASSFNVGTVLTTVCPALIAEPGVQRERCRNGRDTWGCDEEGRAGADRRGEDCGGYGPPGPGAGPVADRVRWAAQAAGQDGPGDRAEPGDDRAPRA